MSWQLVVGLAVLVAAFFIFAIGAAVRAHLRRPTTGVEGMVGATGKTLEALSTQMEGGVQVVGERWKARSRQESIAAGEKVEVVAVEGLTLIVKRAEKES